MGMAVVPCSITIEAIYAYCEMMGITRADDREFLMKIIPTLDEIWMDDWHTREKKKADAKKK